MSTAHKPDLRELYERYGRAVYRRCQYFLKSDADAKDALHDVFLKAGQNYDDFLGSSSPLTWLVRITTNHCLNVLRGRRAGWRARYEQTVTVDRQDAPTAEARRIEQRQLVQRLLTRVDADAAAAAVYYFVDEMSQEDAAVAAGCSVPTLRKRLRAFIKAARRELKTEDAALVFGEEPP